MATRTIFPGNWRFGVWIRRRREDIELKQDELAERLGVSVPTVRRLEHGERGLTNSEVITLARSLDVSEDQVKEAVTGAGTSGSTVNERGDVARALGMLVEAPFRAKIRPSTHQLVTARLDDAIGDVLQAIGAEGVAAVVVFDGDDVTVAHIDTR